MGLADGRGNSDGKGHQSEGNQHRHIIGTSLLMTQNFPIHQNSQISYSLWILPTARKMVFKAYSCCLDMQRYQGTFSQNLISQSEIQKIQQESEVSIGLEVRHLTYLKILFRSDYTSFPFMYMQVVHIFKRKKMRTSGFP